MRKIKTANLTFDSFLIATSKNNTTLISKNDFMEELESFLSKNHQAEIKSNDSKEIAKDEEENLEVKENEEDFDAELIINLMNLTQLANRPIDLNKANESGGKGDHVITPDSLVEVKSSEVDVTNLLSENMISAQEQQHIEKFMEKPEIQLSEKQKNEMIDVNEKPLFERNSKLDNVSQNVEIKKFEDISPTNLEEILTLDRTEIAAVKATQDEGMGIKEEIPIQIKQNEIISSTRDKETVTRFEKKTETLEQTKSPSVEADAPIQKVTQEDSVLNSESFKEAVTRLEKKAEALEQTKLSSMEVYEPSQSVSFSEEVDVSIQKVTQEDFVLNIESLIIKETESLDNIDRTTLARIQLTPERLGKVDLQIEINGKELTAKLVVEEKGTKEWIEQQVTHLKEQLLVQEITIKDFQVVVHKDSLNDTFMNNEENPFFKQKQKDSQTRKEQRLSKKRATDLPIQREERGYFSRNAISILV